LEEGDGVVKKGFYIFVKSGPLAGHKYGVKTNAKILIGRGDEANIRIGYDNFCSRRHALIFLDMNSCYLEDLNSTNGTYVNGKRINEKIQLNNGDIIGLGLTELLITMSDLEKGRNSVSGDEVSFDD